MTCKMQNNSQEKSTFEGYLKKNPSFSEDVDVMFKTLNNI